jgi:exodeoxyribonuclease VII large subunit
VQLALDAVQVLQDHMRRALLRRTEQEAQRIDQVSMRIGRPSALAHRQRLRVNSLQQSLVHALQFPLKEKKSALQAIELALPRALQRALVAQEERGSRLAMRLELLDPRLVLRRGYAWLSDEHGRPLGSVKETHAGQPVVATLADGAVDMTVVGHRPN